MEHFWTKCLSASHESLPVEWRMPYSYQPTLPLVDFVTLGESCLLAGLQFPGVGKSEVWTNHDYTFPPNSQAEGLTPNMVVSGGGVSVMGFVSFQEEEGTGALPPSLAATWGPSKKVAIWNPGRRQSPEPNHPDTLTSSLQNYEERISIVEAPYLWYFVLAAPADWDRSLPVWRLYDYWSRLYVAKWCNLSLDGNIYLQGQIIILVSDVLHSPVHFASWPCQRIQWWWVNVHESAL